MLTSRTAVMKMSGGPKKTDMKIVVIVRASR